MTIPLIMLALSLPLQADGPVSLDRTRQLFLDDYLIASRVNVTRQVHPAQKFPDNPILYPTEPWEGQTTIVYGSVIRDEGTYRAWYYAGGHVGYAESRDGIHWQKPPLGLVKINGQDTNLVIDRQAPKGTPGAIPYFYELFGVHRDDRASDSNGRYKMGFLSIQRNYQGPHEDPFHHGQRRGLGVAASPDGIHWRLVDNWATEAICDGGTHWMYDIESDKYVLFGRTKHVDQDVLKAWGPNDWIKKYYWGRAVARVASDDFITWNRTRPASAPVVMAADAQDRPGTEIYSMQVFPYESIYIGLVQIFHNQADTCYLDIQLACSRDGVHFTRLTDRSPFLPLGPVGRWDRFNNSLANSPPLLEGDTLRFYYGGRSYRHTPYQGKDKGQRFGGIGLATLPRDRFVSLRASYDEGTIMTRPLQLRGRRLHLNAKSDFGRILVEVLDTDSRLLVRSKPIIADSLDISVDWESGSLKKIDSPVVLRITLCNALLFSMWCL